MNKSVSMRQLKDQRKKDFFVGRRKEIDIFMKMIEQRNSEAYPILNIVGIGGIGKSTLLRHYIKICEDKEDLPCALVDGRAENIKLGVVSGRVICNLPEILKQWRDQLMEGRKGNLFREFDKDIQFFNRILQKYWKTEKGEAADIGKLTGDIAGSLVSATLTGVSGIVLGGVLGTVSSTLADAIGRTSSQLINAGLDEMEMEFCLHIERKLASSFAQGINRLIEQTKCIVIMLDTFELMQSFQDWIINYLLETDISGGLRLIIAGRAPLDNSRWYDWSHIIKTLELESLATDAMCEFLVKHGVRNDDLIKKAEQITGGIPWALRLLTDNLAIMDGDWELHFEKGLRYEMSKQIVDRFLDQLDSEEERRIIDACAVPLTFDADLIQTMLNEEFPGMSIWRKVTGFSFFEILPNGRLFMTDPIREFIIDRLKVEQPLTLRKWNDKASEYYGEIIKTSDANLTGFVWDYLFHYFFDDLEARHLFLPRREYIDRVIVKIPSLEDAEKLLAVDQLTMGTDPEIMYDLDDMEGYLKQCPSMMRMAIDKETGRVVGYALIVSPPRSWARSFEAKDHQNRLHTNNVLDDLDAVDYLFDTIAVIDPNDHITSALLIRSLLPLLMVKPRKLYSMAVSKYGIAISKKLQMNHLFTWYTTDGFPVECFYFCLYAGQRNSPLYEALEKFRPDIPMETVCLDCEIDQCPLHSQFAGGKLARLQE